MIASKIKIYQYDLRYLSYLQLKLKRKKAAFTGLIIVDAMLIVCFWGKEVWTCG